MGTVVMRRPPRVPPAPLLTEPVAIEPPPELPTEKSGGNWMMAVPMVAGGGAMAFMAIGRGGSTALLGGGMMLVSMVSMLFMSVGKGGRQRKGQINGDRRDYLRYLGVARDQIRSIAAHQRAALLWQHPHPQALWTVAASLRLWERRVTDRDFGLVRVGLGPQRLSAPIALPDTGLLEDLESVSAVALRRFVRAHSTVPNLPVAISLPSFSHVAIVAEPETGRAAARALVAELTTLHSPDDVLIAVCAGPEQLDEWEWVKWLPHAQHPTKTDGVGPVRLVADTWRQLEEWLEDVVVDRDLFTPNTRPNDGPLVVVVLDGGEVESGALIAPGASPVGMCGVLLAAEAPVEAPNALRLVIADGQVSMLGSDRERPLGRADEMSRVQSEALARLMSPFRVSTQTGQDDAATDPLTTNTGLTELLQLGDAAQLDVRRAWRPRSVADRLRVPLGPGADGLPVFLDLKESAQGGMGPHGLVIGATGSGKSELLRTMVLGIAATHSSETVNFVLVDFKGGATFAGLAELPHTAAVITNLQDDLTMVDRMKDAIAGEMNRRQEALRDAGNYSSVRDYEIARVGGAALPPLPSLLIVCDEFSELLSAKPDFIDLFLAIGRLGRSLAVHLCLASQRLEEGKLRGLDSHLSYRVGLKTFSAAESRVVLGVPDAYELPPVPGSAYLKYDADMWRFKAAYVSGPYEAVRTVQPNDPTRSPGRGATPTLFGVGFVPPPRESADSSDEAGSPVVIPTPESAAPEAEAEQAVLDVIVDRLQGQGPPAHTVWLPPLEASPTLDQLLPGLETTAERGLTVPARSGNGSLTTPIGIVDRPYEQRRDPLLASLSGSAGHVVIIGAPQSGKSNLIRTLIGSLALTHTPAEVQFYCLDFGGGTLTSIADLPHVGTIASRLETDAVRRMVAEVKSIVGNRERLFLQHRIDSMASYRTRRAAGEVDDGFGDVFLVVDGWSVLRQEFEQLEQSVIDLAGRSLTYGVHLVIASNRWAEVRPALKDLIGTRYELRLGDPADSEVDRRMAINVPASAPGRGLTRQKFHFLGGLPRIDGDPIPTGVGAAAQKFSDTVAAAWSGPRARPVRMLPETVAYEQLAQAAGPGRGQLLLGIDEAELAPVYLDIDAEPHLVVFGDGETGKTALLRTLIRGITERYTPAQAQIAVVDYRRSLLSVVPPPYLLDYSATAKAAGSSVGEIAAAMLARAPGPDVTPDQLRERSWWKGPELFVVVDDYELVAAQSGNPLVALADLIPQGKDVGLHVILCRRSGGAARALYDPLIQRIRELAMPGILLSGSKDEGPLLGSTKPMTLAPGRGQLVTRKRGAELVQIAWTPGDWTPGS